MLCQLPLPITTAEIPTPTEWEFFLVNCLSGTCTTASHIRDWTSKDTFLSQKHFILSQKMFPRISLLTV